MQYTVTAWLLAETNLHESYPLAGENIATSGIT
ncbi:unnamed protein product, partial [Linum tenue]